MHWRQQHLPEVTSVKLSGCMLITPCVINRCAPFAEQHFCVSFYLALPSGPTFRSMPGNDEAKEKPAESGFDKLR